MDAFRRHGLYYPFFHVRDDRWLKVSALYWPRMARLVPEGYPTRDSATARAFSAADPDFLYRVSASDSVERVGVRFAQALEACGHELTQRLNRYSWQYGAAGVHISHMSGALLDQLLEMRLALYPISPWETFKRRGRPVHTGSPPYEDGDEDGERFPLITDNSEGLPVLRNDWVAMPKELVVVYNSMLVETVAAANHLQPTTDLPDAFTVVNNWSAGQIAAALLGRPGPPDPASASELAQALALLAINVVVPANLDEVPAEKIIEIRLRYGAEFQAFGLAVDQAAADLAELADVRDPAVLDRYLNDEVSSRFIRPAENLRQQLSGLKLDAASMTINVKTELPAAAGLIGGATLAGHPLVAGTAAAALGLLTIRRGIRRQRDSVLEAAPAESYLFHLGDNLEARRMVSEVARRFQQIAGIGPG